MTKNRPAIILRGRNTLKPLAGWLGRAGLNLAFPIRCLICGQELPASSSVLICGSCCGQVTAGNKHPCPRCAYPNHISGNSLKPNLADDPDKNHAADRIGDCVQCQHIQFHFRRTAAIGPYRDLLRETVIRMKHANEEALALAMGRILGRRIAETGADRNVDIMVPVPIHWTRRFGRGYNVSEILVQGISTEIGLKHCDRLLKSLRRTKKQGTLMVGERKRNVRGAFGLNSQYELNGATVLIVDDVMTTGSTMNEAARICRRGGATEVRVAVAVRGIGAS